MKKLLILFLVVAVVGSFGVAFADKPTPDNPNTGKPSNPPCDSDHGHPLMNLMRLGKDCPPSQGPCPPQSTSPKCEEPEPSPSPSPTNGEETTCSTDFDGDGEPHSAFAPENNEGGLASSIVHGVDQAFPSPIGGDQGLVTEVNCAVVVSVEEILGING